MLRFFLTLLVFLNCSVVAVAQSAMLDTPPPAASTSESSPTDAAPVDVPQTYERVLVEEVIEAGIREDQSFERLRVRWLTGSETGRTTEMEFTGAPGSRTGMRFQPGDTAVVTNTPGTNEFFPTEPYRLPAIAFFAGLLVAIAIAAAGWRAVGAVIGLVLSGAVLLLFVIPQLLAGASPLPIIAVGAGGVAALNLFLAHGFRRQSVIAFVATLITLALAVGLAGVAIFFTHLFGAGSETSFFVQLATNYQIDLRGILLGGIIIGVIGVLDDITTAQVAIVTELRAANPAYTANQLFAAAMRIGREHITSMLNTLVLAYAGASLPLFILVAAVEQPLWVTANTETIAEEIIRTLVGSIALIAAVPITTLIAVWWARKK